MSSALPLRRRSTVFLRTCACAFLMIGFDVTRGHVGLDPAGLDDVGADAPVGVDVGRGSRQALKRPLRGGVAAAEVARDAGYRSDVDDRTSAGVFDQRCAGLDAAQGAGDVDLEDLVPLVDIDVRESDEGVAADDVHQHMQGAGLLFDLGNGGVPLVLIDHVELDEVGRAGGVVELLDQGVAALLVAAGYEYGRTLLGEQPGGGAAHAAVPARDQCNLALQPHAIASHVISRGAPTPATVALPRLEEPLV